MPLHILINKRAANRPQYGLGNYTADTVRYHIAHVAEPPVPVAKSAVALTNHNGSLIINELAVDAVNPVKPTNSLAAKPVNVAAATVLEVAVVPPACTVEPYCGASTPPPV